MHEAILQIDRFIVQNSKVSTAYGTAVERHFLLFITLTTVVAHDCIDSSSILVSGV